MDCIEDTLINLFRGMPNFIYKLEGYNRNSISVYLINNKKILLKQYKDKKFAGRERLFYGLLNKVCKIPKLYGFGEDYIITEYIESSTPDLNKAVEDWAVIHSIFLDNEVLENPNIPKHKLRDLSEDVWTHKDMFGKISKKLIGKLLNKERNMNKSTIIHGDLFGRNILSLKGENNYIDFEFSGVGHPVRDLSLLLLNHPDREEEIIRHYKDNICFDYKGIEEDINNELLNKGVQLIIGLGNLKIPSEERKKIHGRFLKVLENHLD
jgi:thiamine kinase-like enzyme